MPTPTTRTPLRRRRATRRPRPAAQLPRRLGLFVPGRSLRLQLAGGIIAAIVALSAQSFASAREGATTYLIQPGDTLWAIATATGTSIERLVGLNGIANPDFILAGQVLQLDGAADQTAASVSPNAAASGQRYTVKPGDTLWDISVATGVPTDTLAKLNQLADADRLSAGQQLVLTTAAIAPATRPPARPAAAAPAPAATPSPMATKPQTNTPQQPAPAAAAPSATSTLQQRVIAEARRVGGPNVRVGVAARNLVTGERISVHADEEFPSASVMKLPILVELERQTANGTIAWTDALRAQAGMMITISDNAAANQIANLVGQKSVNDTMARLGLTGTHLVNPFSDARSRANAGMNETTPSDMAKLLELIATDQVLNAQVSADIRGYLARSGDRSKLVRLLPADARVAHKSGWYDGVANDVGIVTVDRAAARWVIAVFSDGDADAETGNQLVAAVSRAVYDAWAAE